MSYDTFFKKFHSKSRAYITFFDTSQFVLAICKYLSYMWLLVTLLNCRALESQGKNDYLKNCNIFIVAYS